METAQISERNDWLPRVIIRHMRPEDLLALEWDGEYTHFRQLYTEAFARFERGVSVLWVAELPGEGVIGQVFIQLITDRMELADGKTRAYFYSFRIKSEYRNAGLGSRIMDTVEADLRRRKFKWITLNVAKDNPDARRLYERRGFHVIANEPGIWSFKDHNGDWQHVEEPAWRMEKRIA